MAHGIKIEYVSSKEISDYLFIEMNETVGTSCYGFQQCSSCGVFHKINGEDAIYLSKKSSSTKKWSISLKLTDEETINTVTKFALTHWHTGYISSKEVEELIQKINPMK